MTTSPKGTKSATASRKRSGGLTDEERAALKETMQERKAAARGSDGEDALLAKIDEMPDADRRLAERIHAIVKANAPDLASRTWYGMPAYANEHGKVVCFFTPASKFKSRYASFGFEEAANLDDGTMWPTAFALTEVTPADEARIGELVRKAASPTRSDR